MTGDRSVMEDYRKCSYKDRLRLLRNLEEGSTFYETKAGKRLLKSVREKMEFEKLTEKDFEVQKKESLEDTGENFLRDLRGGGTRRPLCRDVWDDVRVNPRLLE